MANFQVCLDDATKNSSWEKDETKCRCNGRWRLASEEMSQTDEMSFRRGWDGDVEYEVEHDEEHDVEHDEDSVVILKSSKTLSNTM